jgi:hypothetical protein
MSRAIRRRASVSCNQLGRRQRSLFFESLEDRRVLAENIAPVNTVPPAQTYTLQERTVRFDAVNRISTYDADAGSQNLRVTLFVNRGTITLDSTAGLTFVNGGNSTRYLLFDGPQSSINAALMSMTYRANTGVTSDVLTIDTHDLGHSGTGGAKVDRDTVALAQFGTTTNQAPVNSVPGPQVFSSNDRTVTFGTANRISTNDPDVGNNQMRMTLFVNGGSLFLGSTSGLTFRNGGNGTSYLLFDGTQADINAALINLTYVANANTTSDVLTIDTHDLGNTGSGGAKVDRDTVSLSLVASAINQAPVNTVPVAQAFTAENRTVTFGALNRISTNDPDVGNGQMRVTLFVNQGIISLGATTGLTFLSGGNNTRYLLFDGTQENINNALLNMTYTANSNVTSDLLTIDTHDLGNTGSGGAKVDRDSVSLFLVGSSPNQKPVNVVGPGRFFTNSNPTVTWGANNPIGTSDPDAGDLPLRVTLFVNGGVLTLGSTNGLTFRGGANNSRYLLFDGSQTDINNALFNLTYTANANTNQDLLTLDTHDLGHTGSGGAKVDRDTVTLTRIAGSSFGGRSGGNGSGEANEPMALMPLSQADASLAAAEADSLYEKTSDVLQSPLYDNTALRLIDLLASTNSGRAQWRSSVDAVLGAN